MMLRSVDLPQPEAPAWHEKRPAAISSETWPTACTAPRRVLNTIEMSETEIELTAAPRGVSSRDALGVREEEPVEDAEERVREESEDPDRHDPGDDLLGL